jgi:hypothetical protein
VPIWRLYRGFKGKSFGNFPNLEDNRQYTHKEQKGREGETEGGGGREKGLVNSLFS